MQLYFGSASKMHTAQFPKSWSILDQHLLPSKIKRTSRLHETHPEINEITSSCKMGLYCNWVHNLSYFLHSSHEHCCQSSSNRVYWVTLHQSLYRQPHHTINASSNFTFTFPSYSPKTCMLYSFGYLGILMP